MAIDIMFGLSLISGFYVGYSRGIIKTVFSVIGLLFGALAAFRFAPAMTEFLETAFSSTNPLMFVAGFALAFFLAMFLIRLFSRGLEGAFKTANINFINQALGGFVTAIFMVVVYSVLLWFGVQAHLVNEEVRYQSKTYPILKEVPGKAMVVVEEIKPILLDFWDQSIEMMDRLEDMSIEQTEDNNVYDIPTDDQTDRSDY